MTRIMLMVGLAVQVTLVGCRPNENPAPAAVTVFAAASLNDVLDQLARTFEETRSVAVTISTGASGALCAQIELGAPCDVFLSADPALVDRLDAEGRVLSNSRCVLAQNRLVIAVAAPTVMARDWPGGLSSERVSRIALADPDSAPAGRYAMQALVKLNLWGPVMAKAVRAGDVRSAARLLALRTVDAAIVYETDVAATSGVAAAYVFAAGMHAPIDYVGAAIESSESSLGTREIATDFLEFLQSHEAQAVWRKHGFALTTRNTETESP